MRKKIKCIKLLISIALICGMIFPSFAVQSSSDDSFFITKKEFDAALADFNARLTTFEAGINSKIDSQVTSYLDRNGIWSGRNQTLAFPNGKNSDGVDIHNQWYCNLMAKYTRETVTWYPQAIHIRNTRIGSSWNSTNYGSDYSNYDSMHIVGGKAGTSGVYSGSFYTTKPYIWANAKYEYEQMLCNEINKSGMIFIDMTYGWFYNYGNNTTCYSLKNYEANPSLYYDLNEKVIDSGVAAGNADFSGARIAHFNTVAEHSQCPAYSLNFKFATAPVGSSTYSTKAQGIWYTWTAPFADFLVFDRPWQEEAAGYMIPSRNPTRVVYTFFVQKGDKIKFTVWDEFGGLWKGWGWSPSRTGDTIRKFVSQINECKVY